jgi:hypothetical protein
VIVLLCILASCESQGFRITAVPKGKSEARQFAETDNEIDDFRRNKKQTLDVQ